MREPGWSLSACAARVAAFMPAAVRICRAAGMLAVAGTQVVQGCLAAEPAAPSGSAGNFFRLPAGPAAPLPTFQGGRRAGMAALADDGIPNLMQVKQIISLTPAQRRQIQQIFESARGQMSPQLARLRAMREAAGMGGEAALAEPGAGEGPADRAGRAAVDPQMRQALAQLREETRARRQAVWRQVQAVLTAGQLEELEMMRRGMLLPGGLAGR